MKIRDALFTAGKTGFFFDDQAAIKAGATQDGFVYLGEPRTEGFHAVRQAGESISVLLILENGQTAAGDCAAVQYSGAGGRDPLFLAEHYIPLLEEQIKPLLIGLEAEDFLANARYFDGLELGGGRLHTAIRYGLSQALLDAAARASGVSMARIILAAYGLEAEFERIPIFAQTGDERYANADKMIIKGAEVIPHGLINNIDDKLGREGEKLAAYVGWLKERVARLKPAPDYLPIFHIDLYGNLGRIFDNDPAAVAAYLKRLEPAAGAHELYIEGPVDMGERSAQIRVLGSIRRELEAVGSRVKIVADEWCNTIEDIKAFTDAKCCHMVQIKTPDLGSLHNVAESVLYCREHGMEAYQGGTCNETDVSSRACVNVAMAVRAERILAKPGMGFDEGYQIVNNEMERVIALLRYEEKEKQL